MLHHHTRPSGLHNTAATRRPLAGSRREAARLLASLAQDDLVRPELRNDAILAPARSERATAAPATGHRRPHR